MGIAFDFFDLNLSDPVINTKFSGMYASFFNGIREHGCKVTYSQSEPGTIADVLVLPIHAGAEPILEGIITKSRVPVILFVPPASSWFNRERLERWRRKVLFSYGVDASTLNYESYSSLGINYHSLPLASDPTVMQPLGLKPIYDVVFIGSITHGVGRYPYMDALMPLMKDRRYLFIGNDWDRYGIPKQLVAWGDLLNVIYNLGRICINIHLDEQKMGREAGGLNLNNRVFDYALAGSFQISDNPEGVYIYFNDDEIVAVAGIDDWVDKIFYYLDHPEKTETFREKARQRVLNEHTWYQRAAKFVEWTTSYLNGAGSFKDIRLPMQPLGERLRDVTLTRRVAMRPRLRRFLKQWL